MVTQGSPKFHHENLILPEVFDDSTIIRVIWCCQQSGKKCFSIRKILCTFKQTFFMRNLVRTILPVMLTIHLACLTASSQENYEVRQIKFHGNKTLDKEILQEGMATKGVSYLEKLITKKEPSRFSEELIKLDIERVNRIYQREGFLETLVTPRPFKVNDKKHTISITMDIREGEPIGVDSIFLNASPKTAGINTDPLFRKMAAKMELKAGSRFRDAALNADLQRIRDAYRNLGHAYASARYTLNLRPDEKRTSVGYEITPGPVSFFGETEISGNRFLSEKFLRRQLVYQEGDLYNKSRLDETRQNFYRLQLFRIVSVVPDPDAETRKSPVPVKIYLEEAPRVSTRFGFGYGTEDLFRTFVDLNYLSPFRTASRLNLYLKHSALEPYYAGVKWTFPQFPVRRSTVSVNPFISRNSEPGYETRAYGINVPFSYIFNDRLSTTLSYYLEDVEQQVEAGDQEFPDMEKEDFPYYKSGILLTAAMNNSTPRFSPEKGINLMAGFKVNGYLFGSDFNYTRLWADFRTYHKISAIILAFRAMAGGIKSRDDGGFIPVEDRFYSGGSNSVRGWNRSELGPQRESGTPLGGKSIIESSLELRLPLFWRLSGVAFLDAGNVWTGPWQYKVNDLAYAAGTGLRIDTPIGPVRLDVGFPVWNEKKSPQIFISVGQAF